jgi:serine protease Do
VGLKVEDTHSRTFFGPRGDDNPSRDFRQRSLGSGFIIDKDGYIVTNNHVIEDADEIKVRLSNDKEFDAEIVGRDEKTDLALIRIAPSAGLKPLKMGDSDDQKVGSWVVAIGSPFGLEQTVTAGIVSAKGRAIGAGPYDDFIQTDASINPGNSGGPLINMQGEVIGINTAIVASGQGIGFAIPVNLAKGILQQLKDKGAVTRGWLGVGIQNLTPELKDYYGIDRGKGVLVTEVYEGQPAEKGGIEVGDVIIAVNGESVDTSRDLSSTIAGLPVGDKASIRLLRDNREKTVHVTLGKRSEGERLALGKSGDVDNDLGLKLSELNTDMAARLGLENDAEGLLVAGVRSDSKAAEAGLRTGDLIVEMNREPINSLGDYNKQLSRMKKGDTVRFLIKRMREGFVVVKLVL